MIIQTEDLWKRYGRHEALQGLNLSVPEGSAFVLIGANGAGKTTTIKILMNMLQPSRGTAAIFGKDTCQLSPREFAQIGYVSENQQMPGRMTVGQYLDYLRPFYPAWDKTLELSILAQLRLPADRRIKDLSHGMRLKMALACALPFRPKLLVLDEPFSGLDPLIRDEFMQELLHQAGEMTILISSHELPEVEGIGTHVGFIDQGRLIFQEPMEDLVGRLREVQVTFNHAATVPDQMPKGWLQGRAIGNVLSFVETQFSADDLNARIGSALGNSIRDIHVRPIDLRTIFTVLARDAQSKGA